jgi:hypothetical protein
VPVHVVAARLGHADPSVTLRVYAHVIRDEVAEAADIFARSISAQSSATVSKSVSKKALLRQARTCDLGALGGTRTPNLLIRRCPYWRPVPFGTVRDLRLVFFGCSAEYGASEGCSSVWLPAWLPSAASELRITRVFSCVARRPIALASFMSAGCCWCRVLAVEGSSGTSRGHASATVEGYWPKPVTSSVSGLLGHRRHVPLGRLPYIGSIRSDRYNPRPAAP